MWETLTHTPLPLPVFSWSCLSISTVQRTGLWQTHRSSQVGCFNWRITLVCLLFSIFLGVVGVPSEIPNSIAHQEGKWYLAWLYGPSQRYWSNVGLYRPWRSSFHAAAVTSEGAYQLGLCNLPNKFEKWGRWGIISLLRDLILKNHCFSITTRITY